MSVCGFISDSSGRVGVQGYIKSCIGLNTVERHYLELGVVEFFISLKTKFETKKTDFALWNFVEVWELVFIKFEFRVI